MQNDCYCDELAGSLNEICDPCRKEYDEWAAALDARPLVTIVTEAREMRVYQLLEAA